jgi:hypothetical protein
MTSPTEQHDPPDNSRPQATQNASPSGKPRLLANAARLVKPPWLVIVPSVLAVIGLSVVLVHVIAGGGSHPAASAAHAHGTSASPNPDSTEPTPQFHVPAKVIAIAGPHTDALPLPKGLQAPVKAWDAGSGGAELGAVSGQLGNVTQASGLREYVAMEASCVKLAADVRTAQAGPPIPDAAMQTLYATALGTLAKGAEDCRAAISQQPDGDEYIMTTENQPMLHAAAAAFTSASEDLYRATDEIMALSLSH